MLNKISLFGGATTLRNTLYDRGLLRTERIEGVKVVSVGAIRTGGSGKTPLAMHVAECLKNLGHKTGILIRGYKGTMEHKGGLVSLGRGPLVSAKEAGDEAYMISQKTEGIHVFVGANREKNAGVLRDLGIKAIVLDDGFQRRSLWRDLDIALICPEDLDALTRLIPSGPLRERKEAIRRSHITAGLLCDWLDQDNPPQLLVDYHLEGFVFLCECSDSVHPRPCNEKAYLISGIARPDRFRKTVEQAGLSVVGVLEFRDHHVFSPLEIQSAVTEAKKLNADIILTTEKDLVRMPMTKTDPPIMALKIKLKIHSGAELLNKHLTSL